ncbi:MAG: hypothetical protein ABUL67_03305 [Haliangium ochraceum]
MSAAGCHSERRPTLNVRVIPRDDLPAIARLVVTASAGTRTVSAAANGSQAQPIAWPVTVTLNTAGLPAGDTVIEATAFDASQTMVARGTSPVILPSTDSVLVELRCQSLICSQPGMDGGPPVDAAADLGWGESDAGTPTDAPVDVVGPGKPGCGNGVLDPGETCDIGRALEFPGACPAACDDGIPCTTDERKGEACTVSCTHVETTTMMSGDTCCPAGADHGSDADCSATCGNQRVDPGETCDIAITNDPGACPSPATCDDNDPCTTDSLISAGTCSARCAHANIVAATNADGCCPIVANALTDSDCRPACGNGIVESGELCDVSLPLDDGGCPTAASCDDANPCTTDTLSGVGCQSACLRKTIVSPTPGDGCCPQAGLGRNLDSDCPTVCGNAVIEAGEACDSALIAPAAGTCPTSCPPPPGACLTYVLRGAAMACSAACVATPVSTCASVGDGCCPSGCTRLTDPDCSATCGNGTVDTGETCDTAIATGTGACPKSCADGTPCTDDLLVDRDSCSARCLFVPTTTLRNGDGCCPPNAHAGIDTDCPATCGNGVVETPAETCDTATTPTSCPASCPAPESCATWNRTVTSSCDVRCTRLPLVACANADGCCAPGCSAINDSDCPARCGNGILEPGEACDRGITAGHADACAASCADADACTVDSARGNPESCSRACSHARITACAGGDGCCPAGCSAQNDNDCSPECGDGHVQATETCDPTSTCPTSCPSDGDSCTIDQLVGSAATCNAACAHVPILRCSGAQRDGCCPTDCGTASDSDC